MKLHLPRGINYECIQCGQSCRMFKEVRVGPRSEERLLSLDFRPLMAEGTRNETPLVPSPTVEDKMILRRHCGTCVFQRGDGLCGIHAEHGYESKPQTCRDFPYRFVETDDGVYTGLSFACTAVLQNMGPAVMDQREGLEAAHLRSNARRNARGRVALTHRHEISWPALLALEDDLRALLEVGGKSVSESLLAQAVYIDLYARLLREIRGDLPQGGAAANPHARFDHHRFPADSGQVDDLQVLETLRKRHRGGGDFAETFAMVPRFRANPMMQRAFIGLITAFRQSFFDNSVRPSRVGAIARIMRHYLSSALRLGSIHLDPLERSFRYADFAQVAFIEDGETHELLGRYFRHCLFRKDLLLAESIWMGQRMMLMHLALVRWYAVGITVNAGGPRVTIEAVREAIRQVELRYLFHTKFSDLFDRVPALGTILQATVSKPVFAAAMAGPPV